MFKGTYQDFKFYISRYEGQTNVGPHPTLLA